MPGGKVPGGKSFSGKGNGGMARSSAGLMPSTISDTLMPPSISCAAASHARAPRVLTLKNKPSSPPSPLTRASLWALHPELDDVGGLARLFSL